MYFGHYVKYPLFLSDFHETWRFFTEFIKMLTLQFSWKYIQWQPSCFTRTKRRTDMTKLKVAFRYFANAPKYRLYFPCRQATCYIKTPLLLFIPVAHVSPVLVATKFCLHLPEGRTITSWELSNRTICISFFPARYNTRSTSHYTQQNPVIFLPCCPSPLSSNYFTTPRKFQSHATEWSKRLYAPDDYSKKTSKNILNSFNYLPW
jgi:hypothetical protein